MSNTKKAIIALIIANTIWGAASPVFKWSLENIHPFTLAFLRFAGSAVLLLPLSIGHLKMTRRDFIKLSTMSLIGLSLSIPIFFLGLQLTSSINAPVISSSGPIILLIGAMIFLKERPKKKVLAGTLISLAGVLLIILQPILKEGLDGGLTGNLLFVASTIGGVIYTLLLKELLKKYEVIPVLFWTFTIAAITTMPFFLNEVHTYGFLPQLNIQGIVGIYFGVFFAATLAYLLFTYSLKILVANEVGLFTYIDPVIAVVIAVPLLGEKVNSIFLLGSVLVFGGIFISENRLHWHPFYLLRRTFSKEN